MSKKKKSFKLNWIAKNLIIALTVLVALGIGIYFGLKTFTHHGEQIPVPDFYGMSVAQAEMTAAEAKVTVEVVDSVFVKRLNRGAVFRQLPEAGTKVKEGRLVRLTINATSIKYIPMPNIVGFSLRQAIAELSANNLKVGRLVYRPDIATNNVLEQQIKGVAIPEGTLIEKEAAIDLVLGHNHKDKTFIPNVTGHTAYDAEDILHNNFLNLGRLLYDETVKDYADSLTAVVYSQYPPTSLDDVNMGSKVDLFLTLDEGKLSVREE